MVQNSPGSTAVLACVGIMENSGYCTCCALAVWSLFESVHYLFCPRRGSDICRKEVSCAAWVCCCVQDFLHGIAAPPPLSHSVSPNPSLLFSPVFLSIGSPTYCTSSRVGHAPLHSTASASTARTRTSLSETMLLFLDKIEASTRVGAVESTPLREAFDTRDTE